MPMKHYLPIATRTSSFLQHALSFAQFLQLLHFFLQFNNVAHYVRRCPRLFYLLKHRAVQKRVHPIKDCSVLNLNSRNKHRKKNPCVVSHPSFLKSSSQSTLHGIERVVLEQRYSFFPHPGKSATLATFLWFQIILHKMSQLFSTSSSRGKDDLVRKKTKNSKPSVHYYYIIRF